MNKKLGIYVHIPFCRAKCSYCDFYSVTGSDNLFGAYSEALKTHIREAAEQLAECDVDTIYSRRHADACRVRAPVRRSDEIAKVLYNRKSEITFRQPERPGGKRPRLAGPASPRLDRRFSQRNPRETTGQTAYWGRRERAVRACKCGFQT